MLTLFKDAAGNPYWPSILTFIGWLLAGIIMFGGFEIARRERGKAHAEKTMLRSKIEDAGTVIEAMRDFTDVAMLNMIGKPYPDGDIVYTTPISKALEGSYKIDGAKVEFLRDEASERIYRDVIAKYPRFPFSYYALACVLSVKGDPSWRDYAKKATSILEKTTKVGGHHPNHDQKLAELRKILGE